MRLLVTRPEPESRALAARLHAMGIDTEIEPLLAVEPCLPSHLELTGVGALVVTSRNALKALAGHADLAAARRLPVYVVGPATARAARELGFEVVEQGPATARDLAAIIAAGYRPAAGELLHLRGEEVAFDLAGALARSGLRLRQSVAYRSLPASRLSPATRALLAAGGLDGIVLMSPATAATFARLVADAGLIEAATHPVYLCLSPAVAARLEPLGRLRTFVAEAPNSEEMLALVARLAALSATRST